jgi:hypothetical protein
MSRSYLPSYQLLNVCWDSIVHSSSTDRRLYRGNALDFIVNTGRCQ